MFFPASPISQLEALRLKILPPNFEPARFLDIVRGKKDGEGGNGAQGDPRNSDRQRKNDAENPNGSPNGLSDATPESVDQAIQAFQNDQRTQAMGLTAARTEAKGPGLKVVLRDGTGAVIRQFTGEEFLRLREAAQNDPKSRGKILDQKL